jgi:hypothetical protein
MMVLAALEASGPRCVVPRNNEGNGRGFDSRSAPFHPGVKPCEIVKLTFRNS